MIHGYISLSGLNSFLIVQNFPNSAHPTDHNQPIQSSSLCFSLKFDFRMMMNLFFNVPDSTRYQTRKSDRFTLPIFVFLVIIHNITGEPSKLSQVTCPGGSLEE